MVEQARGGYQTTGVQVPHADMAAVHIIIIHVQAMFRAFQLGIELAAEYVEPQGLGFLQSLGADQAFGLQTAFIAGVADAGDLSHGESPSAGHVSAGRLCCPNSGYGGPVSSP